MFVVCPILISRHHSTSIFLFCILGTLKGFWYDLSWFSLCLPMIWERHTGRSSGLKIHQRSPRSMTTTVAPLKGGSCIAPYLLAKFVILPNKHTPLNSRILGLFFFKPRQNTKQKHLGNGGRWFIESPNLTLSLSIFQTEHVEARWRWLKYPVLSRYLSWWLTIFWWGCSTVRRHSSSWIIIMNPRKLDVPSLLDFFVLKLRSWHLEQKKAHLKTC